MGKVYIFGRPGGTLGALGEDLGRVRDRRFEAGEIPAFGFGSGTAGPWLRSRAADIKSFAHSAGSETFFR